MAMTVYAGGRQSGKTQKLLELSADTRVAIVCRNRQTALLFADIAKEQNLIIPTPIPLATITEGYVRPDEVLVDETEDVLEVLLGSRVEAATCRSTIVPVDDSEVVKLPSDMHGVTFTVAKMKHDLKTNIGRIKGGRYTLDFDEDGWMVCVDDPERSGCQRYLEPKECEIYLLGRSREKVVIMDEFIKGTDEHKSFAGLGESFSCSIAMGQSVPKIERVIFNKPATITFFEDGTKVVAMCRKGEKYDREKGVLVCIAKKAYGTGAQLQKQLKKVVDKKETKCKSC